MRSDELDQLIDRALSGYAAVEPPQGLERRVLNRIQAGKSRTWYWAFAIPALASLAVGFWMLQPPAPEPLRVSLAPPPAPVVVAPRPVRTIKPKPRTNPKQDQFPAPSPLTREERALLAFAALHPAEAQQTFIDWRKRMDEPIEIKEIQIEPLQSDDSR